MELFQIHVQVLGESRSVVLAEEGGTLVASFDGMPRAFRTVDQTIAPTKAYLAEILIRAGTHGGWSIDLRAGTTSVWYGDPPPIAAIPRNVGTPLPSNDGISKIRNRYREGDGPRRALDNAIEILRHATTSRRRRAA